MTDIYDWILSITEKDLKDKELKTIVEGFEITLNTYKQHTSECNQTVINHIKKILNANNL